MKTPKGDSFIPKKEERHSFVGNLVNSRVVNRLLIKNLRKKTKKLEKKLLL